MVLGSSCQGSDPGEGGRQDSQDPSLLGRAAHPSPAWEAGDGGRRDMLCEPGHGSLGSGEK